MRGSPTFQLKKGWVKYTMGKTKRTDYGSYEPMREGKYRLWPKKKKGARDPVTGHLERPNLVFHGTEDEARLELARIYFQHEKPGDGVTYGELWAGVVKPSLSSLAVRTADGHESIWNRILKDEISDMAVITTTRDDVERVLGGIESPWVQRSTIMTWRKIYNMAGVGVRNPFDRSINRKKAEPRKRPYLDASDVVAWLESIKGQRWEPVLIAEAGGGLRVEEASALNAEDISPAEYRGRVYAFVDINKALVCARRGRVLKETKNTPSERLMVIGEPFSIPLLDAIPASGPICPSRGKCKEGAKAYMSPNDITAEYREMCISKDMTYVNPGKLRGSWRSMQSEAGSSDSITRKAMGHVGNETDERNYLRVSKRNLIKLADNLTALIEDESFLNLP